MDDVLDPLKNPVTWAAPFFVLTILIELASTASELRDQARDCLQYGD